MGRKVWVVVSIVALVCSCAITAGSDFEEMKEQQITKLEVVEEKLLPLLETLEKKQVNQEMSEQVQQTQHEITELIMQQQDALAEATTVAEVRDVMEETKDRVILKTYDGITARESLDEIVQVQGGMKEQQQAVDAVLQVIGQSQTRSLQIVTTQTPHEVMIFLHTFDSQAIIEELFVDGAYVYLQVTFDETSLLKQELFAELDEGVLPEYFLGYRIVKPEVYTIGQVSLSGEQTSLLRGQTRRETSKYHESVRLLPKVRVAVVDTGIDPTHPDLVHALSTTVSGYDFVNNDPDPFDDHLHGTHVAGTIAAAVNGGGVFGVNPFVEIVPLKICTKTGYCPSYAITNALVYAADQGIEVLNMSLGGPGTLLNNPTCAAIEYATSKGSIAVVAAGNANSSASTFIPAACPHTITVGAVNNMLQRASFSNYGPQVDISAPGVDIYSTIPGGGRKSLDGTSMATPHVSATVATVWGKEGRMPTSMMQQRLLSFTTPVGYEMGKEIGPFLNFPALMAAVGVTQETCGGTGCSDEITNSGTGTSAGLDLQVQHLQEFSSSHTGVLVTAGKTVLIDVFGGIPPYRISKENDTIGFARKDTTLSTGIQIANSATEQFTFAGNEDQELELPHDEVSIFTEFTGDNASALDLFDDDVNDDAVHIASAEQFSFRVLGLQPGTSMITVTDAVGKKVEIPVVIEEQIIHLLPRAQLYLKSNDIYRIKGVNQALLGGVQRQSIPWLYAGSATTAGKIVYNIYNAHEKKYQKLTLSVVVGTQSELDEYKGVQSGTGHDPYPLVVDKEHIEVLVGEEVGVFITGGRAGYVLEKGTGSTVGFGNIQGGVILSGSLRVWGLSEGSTSFVVRDVFGRKKQVTVVVKEKMLRVKPGARIMLGGNNVRWKTTEVVADALATTRLYYDGKWYVNGGVQEGVGILRHRIFNYAEQEEQEFVYSLRVGRTLATEPLTTSFEEMTLKVGQITTLRIRGGTPRYTLKKSTPFIGFAQVRGAGSMSIASVNDSALDQSIVMEESGEDEYMKDEVAVREEPQYSSDEIDTEMGLGFTPLEPEIIGDIEIANTQETYTVYLFGLLPGESVVTITDYEGTVKTIKVTVKETVLTGSLGSERGRYYQDLYKMYEVRGISSTSPSIVSTRYSSSTYIYKMERDGISTLTLQLWNPFELKNQQMRYTIRSGTPTTLNVQSTSDIIVVGETARVTITGGGGPYTIHKNNEYLGLGYAVSDMTTIASIPDEHKIILPEGTDHISLTSGAEYSGAITDSEVTTGWTDDDRTHFDSLDPAGGTISISSTPSGSNKQTFRVVGLSSGTTTLTVKDVYGEVKSVEIHVLPREISLTSAYVGGTFRAPYNPRHFIWFMNSTSSVDTHRTRWSVTGLRPGAPQVVGYLRRGHYNPYYLYGIANGSTDLVVDIYNPHERKQQKMTFSVTTTGISSTDLTKLLAEYVIKNKSDGPVSSINPGGGGFVDETTLNTPVIEVISEQDTILGKIVQIKVSGGSNAYLLTLDKSVHAIDTPIQVAYSESGSNQEGQVLEEYTPEISSGIDISSVIITETYTLPVVANRTYSLMIRNPTTISVKDTHSNVTANKLITTNNSYSSFTYTAVKGSTLDLPIHPSYVVGSENNAIMFVVKKADGGYRLSFPAIGSTKLKVSYTNPITGRKTEARIDVNVVEKGALSAPISTGPEIIEKTIYLDPTKEYSLFLEDGQNYEIEHNGLLGFYTPSEYMYANNGQGTYIASNSRKIIFNEEIYTQGIRILRGDGTNNKFSVTGEGGKFVFNLIYTKGLDIDNTFNYSFSNGDMVSIKKIEMNVEDKVNIIFSNAYKEITSKTPGEQMALFKLRFGDDPRYFHWNLKKSLYLNNYISEEGGDIFIYGVNIPSPDLGNLLYGYLAESIGIFDFSLDMAYEVERLNYIGYYPDALIDLRTKIDEDSDIPWYNLGRSLFREQGNEMFGVLMKRYIDEGLSETSSLKLIQEDGIKNICMQTHMKLVMKFSCLCKQKFEEDWIDLDEDGVKDKFTVNIFSPFGSVLTSEDPMCN